MKAQSVRQRHREARLRAQKLARVKDAMDEDGFACCEECGRSYADLQAAMYYLHGHHKVQRSLGGSDEPENISLLCWQCHGAVHA